MAGPRPPRRIRPHIFQPTKYRERGVRMCVCGSLENTAIHRIPERSEQEREVEARRVGERD